jgi:hypothetical protein
VLTSANWTHTRSASRSFSWTDNRGRSDIGCNPLNDFSEQVESQWTVEIPDRNGVDEGGDALKAARSILERRQPEAEGPKLAQSVYRRDAFEANPLLRVAKQDKCPDRNGAAVAAARTIE